MTISSPDTKEQTTEALVHLPLRRINEVGKFSNFESYLGILVYVSMLCHLYIDNYFRSFILDKFITKKRIELLRI